MERLINTNRILFIRDFMTQTNRPVSELSAFLEAFDSCFKDEDCTCIEQRKPRRKSKPSSVHDGTKPNVHPRAKMVRVSFMDRTDYYGSITAATAALHVTQAQVKYALKKHKTINGQEISLQDADSVWRKPETKDKEE